MEDILKVKQRFSIIGNSPQLTAAIERAVKVAPIDLSVLVTGESGSGKEFFPKIIHAYSARKHKKYIAVNCGAIPEGTIDSELFGHEKGSFTGAISTRKGYFEEADGGTIFLDEVAELPLTTQARLLRVLETGEFLKVGSSQVQKTDIRIVAATNVNLLNAVAKGKFREDLYYRLSTVMIDVPPLHDRGDDVILLARKFAADFSEKYMTLPITFAEDARRAMLLYRWPGNVRQLKNIVEQLALFNAGTEIDRPTLIELLPINYSDSAALVATRTQHSYEAEREMLFQMIYSLQREIAEIRAKNDSNPFHSHPDAHNSSEITQLIKYQPDTPFVDLETSKSSIKPDSEAGAEERNISGEKAAPGKQTSEKQAPGKQPAETLNDTAENDVETRKAPETLEQAERETIAAALKRFNGNKKLAAEQLNISSRTLYRKIHELGIDTQAHSK